MRKSFMLRLKTVARWLTVLGIGVALLIGGRSLRDQLLAQSPAGPLGGSEPGAVRLADVSSTVLGPNEGPDVKVEPSGFGTGYFYTYIPASAFVPRGSATTYAYGLTGYIYKTAGSDLFWAPLPFDAGISIAVIRLYYCDTSANDATMWLTYYEGETSPITTDVAHITTSGTPGCTSTAISFTPEYVIRTLNPSTFEPRHYVINISLPDTTSNLRFKAVRVFWRRLISPAPGTATFTDVPTTHPFFQHVEALAASGITGGCGGGNFCPNDPLTRGQMAVFLSRALGLHWPY